MILVATVVLSTVVVSLATYVTAGLRYASVVEDRADRLAAADGGLRYGIEKLALQQYAECFTALGNTGVKIPFPTVVNESTVTVTCRKGGNGFDDIQGWAIIVTGEGVPVGQWNLHSQGGAGIQKLLGGPVYVADPTKIDLASPVMIEDGDLWFSATPAQCDNIENVPPGVPDNLTFKPAGLRGMACLPSPWANLYKEPKVTVPTNAPAASFVDGNGCKVWSPGKYTAVPALGSNNYFKSGNYYFENVDFLVDKTIVAGWASGAGPGNYGDQQFVENAPCVGAVAADKASGSLPGATFYLGGTSKIRIEKGKLEILRRRQGNSLVSIHALTTTTGTYTASSLGWNDSILSTKSGSPSQDMVVHGLAWAPRAQLTFGNVTNVANGQLLGGGAFARIDLQAAASASAFIIRVETSEIPVTLILDATATKKGKSTTMRAIVQINDDATATAINSWRVLD